MNVLEIFLKDTFTQTQLRHRMRILKSHLLKALFGSQDEGKLSQADLTWLGSLPEEFLKSFNKDNVYKIFDDLNKQIDALQVLIIYMAIPSSDNVNLRIGAYARKAFNNPNLVIDTKYDPNLIAGIALSWKGMYRDYSLRSTIESKKEEILGSFKKYLK